MKSAEYWIEKLDLNPHPEGGYFKEIYKSGEYIKEEHLPERFHGRRAFSTSIFFLLAGDQVSKFHRIKSDELWHFYEGSSVIIYYFDENRKLCELPMGNNLDNGEFFQAVVPAGAWFGAALKDTASFALCGCTVAPGFDFEDFEMGDRGNLIETYPGYSSIIEKLT